MNFIIDNEEKEKFKFAINNLKQDGIQCKNINAVKQWKSVLERMFENYLESNKYLKEQIENIKKSLM
ncbi:MAG: hypothetical protein IJ848_02160 [Alphaproteobacteria bacterium]|nr:hypothetical protein [Alphaproteobacteria bacterium]